MHLKSCCALLLLALVACQAAPSTFKNIEKKSISENTSKIEKDDLNMEDPGMDKDRAKKHATTFCVEVRDGHEHPCLETKQPVAVVQPEPSRQTLIRPTYVDFPQITKTQVPIQVIHTQAQQPEVVHVAPQPIQTIPQAIQTIQVQHPQPAPELAPQPAPVIFVPPPPPVPQYNVQAPIPQQAPIVNILTPPAPCNVPTPMVIHEHEHIHEHEVEHMKRPIPLPRPERLEPEFRPRPVPIPQPVVAEILPVEPAPCKQDVIVMPSKPVTVYPENQVQTLHVTEVEPRPVVLGSKDCICRHKGYPVFRHSHHPKVHEHHVMLHPGNVAPANIATPLVVQPPCPMSYLSNNRPIILGPYPANTCGDTCISMHQEHVRPHYTDVYPNLYPSTSPEYIPYPVKTHDSKYISPSVTVNAFPYNEARGMFRQAQSSSQKLMENNESKKGHPVARQMIDVPPSGTSKREADLIQLEENQQANIVQEQAVESDKTPVEMKFGE